jgi:hypothetical protein
MIRETAADGKSPLGSDDGEPRLHDAEEALPLRVVDARRLDHGSDGGVQVNLA